MKKYQRIGLGILIGVVSFTTLYVTALLLLPKMVNLNDYKTKISNAIEKESGFILSCEDIQLKRSLSPYLKIHMHHTLVLYPDNEVFLKLKDAELNVKLLPLLLKKVIIKNAKFTRPIINITLNDDFSTSLEKYIDGNKKINTEGFALSTVITDTICERYKLKINDKTTGKLFYLEGDELFLKDFKLNEKAHLILKGALYENEKEYLNYDLDVTSFLTNKKSQFTFSPFKTIYDSAINGNIKGKLILNKDSSIDGFLNINDLSLKVDDVLLSNNNIDFVFKGNKAQIKALMHTSKSDIAEISGDFAYGKKKSIALTTKARNVDLKNLFKVVSSLSQALNIQNNFKDISASGNIDADFYMESDFKKLKSKGNAKVINAQITHNNLPYKITEVNADINLDNNRIEIKEANANVNSTPVSISGFVNEDVSLQIKVMSENLNLKSLVDLFKIKMPVNIKQGRLSFVSDITGKMDKSLISTVKANVFDFVFTDETLKQDVKTKKIDVDFVLGTSKYSGSAILSGLETTFNNELISSDDFKIAFDEKKVIIPENIVKILSSDLKVYGVLSKNSGLNLNFDGDIFASDISKVIEKHLSLPYKAMGKIKTEGSIVSQNGVSDIKVKFNANSDNYLSYAVIKELLNKQSLLSLNLILNKNEINVKDISLYENSSTNQNQILFLNGKIKPLKGVIFDNLKITIPQSLSISTNYFGGEDISLNGNFVLNGQIDQPKITGDAKILYYNIKKYLTAIKNADVNFENNSLKIVAPDVQINNSKLNLLADVDLTKKEKLTLTNVQVHCANLDMNSLFEILEREANPFAKSLIEIENGIATISDFSILDIKARDISTDFILKENVLKLNNISANAYLGTISGALNYDIPNSKLHLLLDGKNVALKDFLYDLCKFNDNIAGTTDFSTNLSMLTGQYNDVINSLNGKLDFKSINGRMGTLGKFEYYLYAQNILYHGFLKTNLNRIADIFTKDNTAQYRTAQGTLLFQNGYMIADSIKTMGNDMSLYVKGRHNILSNQANIDIFGRISDEITNKLGSFGNFSISSLMENQSNKTVNNIMVLPKNVIDEIPDLYNRNIENTKTFKVNILGDINSLGAINSFMWIMPAQNDTQKDDEELPSFSDMFKTL